MSTLAKALQAESDQLKNARREITLFSGEYVGAFAEYYYYRFEIPEELPLRGVERASFMFSQLQPVTIEGKILGLDNQFLTVALPINFGSVLPEIKCSWNHEDHLKPIINALDVAVDNHPVVSALFHPEEPANAHPANIEPTFLPTTTQEQQDAIKKILNTRVAYVWGPIRSGKTHLLALTALNYLKAGKKVLMVAKTNDRVDQAVTQTISLSADLGVDLKAIGARVGLPSKLEAERLGSLSLEYEVGEQKGEKKKMFEERVALLQNYWRTKIHQSLHEDFYGKLSELRQRTNENRKQLDKVSDELKGHKETISREQHASMLEKLKKGFSKEEIGAAQKGLAEKQAQQKRLQAMQQALTTELMRMEAQAPIDSSELKEYQSAVKRLGELGGVKKVAEEVEAFIAVDERALLSSKRFVVTTAATILSDPRLRNNQFDLVVVDDAESVPLPHLAALALRATDRMVVAGDPYQLGPKSYSSSELAQTWLQRDIFLHIARTEHLHQLVEWSQRNAQWCIFLSSHVPTSVKLSSFVASVPLNDQLKVSASPETKGKIYFLDTGD
ncbi:MAG: AAA domain-containing protein, partial [Bacteroidota bacterium]